MHNLPNYHEGRISILRERTCRLDATQWDPGFDGTGETNPEFRLGSIRATMQHEYLFAFAQTAAAQALRQGED